jgi:hypothetical protein
VDSPDIGSGISRIKKPGIGAGLLLGQLSFLGLLAAIAHAAFAHLSEGDLLAGEFGHGP